MNHYRLLLIMKVAFYLQNSEIELRKLTARLIAVTGANPDIRIFVRGDKTIDYGRVMQVMGTINARRLQKGSFDHGHAW